MRSPGDYRALSDSDHHRMTRPMGEPLNPRSPARSGAPDPGSYPYQHPSGRGDWRQPIPSHVVHTPTPPQPQPIYPPEPFIAQMETAKSTKQIASDIRQIKLIIFLIFLSALVLVSAELFIATRISSIVTLNQF